MRNVNGLLRSLCGRATMVVVLGASFSLPAAAAPSPAVNTEASQMVMATGTASRTAQITAILDRWQVLAAARGQDVALWRDVMGIQLSQVSNATLATIAGIDTASTAKGVSLATQQNYEKVLAAVMGDIGVRAVELTKGPTKVLGSTLIDLVFTPVGPCRIVDTRNVGGNITALTTRQFFAWSVSSSYDFGIGQGGISGAVGTVCPGMYFNSAAGTGSDANVPTAAMMTVTVVGQGGPGNFVVWSGTGSVPNSSALNFNAATGAIANTTVVPLNYNRATTPFLDFGVYVNSPTSAGVVIDITGYFTAPFGSALSCVETATASGSCAASGGNCTVFAPSCAAGFNTTSINCETSDFLTFNAGFNINSCEYHNTAPGATNGIASHHCCRIDGR